LKDKDRDLIFLPRLGSLLSMQLMPGAHTLLLEDEMLKALFALSMAGTLLVPHMAPALGKDSVVRIRPVKSETWDALSLPPIPYLDTMPWLFSEPAKRPKVDIWLNPQLQNVGPLIALPNTPRSFVVSDIDAVDQQNSARAD
jgi:hypothetical protein